MTRLSSVERRLEIVRAALRVIAAVGVPGATTRAIVAEAGMSLASFHYAFASRDEMMRELIAHVVENETIAAFGSLPPEGDIRSLIHQALSGYFQLVTDNPGHEQVMFELMHYALRTPGLDDLPAEQYASYRAAVTELLTNVSRVTGVTWSMPVEDVARMAVALTDGLTLGWLSDRDDAAAAHVIDFAADSLAALARPAAPGRAAPDPVTTPAASVTTPATSVTTPATSVTTPATPTATPATPIY